MAFSHIVGGTAFTDASFQGNAYADEATGFPKALEKIVEHVANAYHGTSMDPLTVGAGSKALTISNTNGQIPAFAIGMPVRIAQTADPAGVWMQGEITAWDGVSGVATINVDATKGSGSFSDWSIAIGGHLTTASGAPPLAVSQGGTGASSGKAALANLTPVVSGIIETNANFVDAVIFGPALDPVNWSPRTAAATSSLMLATVEDGGADAEINIWNLTDDPLAGATPLATVTITSVATPTSIAAAMGYIIVGHEDGVTIIDPHDDSWAERTTGWPRSLSTSTTPALNNDDVIGVAAGYSDKPAYDPRTDGNLPTFAVKYGTGTAQGSVIKDDGSVWELIGAGATPDTGIAVANGHVYVNYDATQFRWTRPISMVTADQSVNPPYLLVYNDNDPYNIAAAADKVSVVDKLIALASGEGLGFNWGAEVTNTGPGDVSTALNASITRSFNTGYYPTYPKGLWLANSKTVDRSVSANTLTENGAITEAAVEAGAELKGYSGFSASNHLTRSYDADFDFASGMSIAVWVKTLNNTAQQDILSRDDPADVILPFYNVSIHPTTGKGQLYYYTTASSTGNVVATLGPIDDGKWHLLVFVHDAAKDEFRSYLDGVYQAVQTHGGTGSFANASAILRIGEHVIPAATAPADQTEISLLRISATVPTDNQIRQMYEAEKGMFVANAKCLLQSGTTDAVLDVSVDPIAGKVAVTQTDAAMIFDGLVVVSEPSLAADGSTWERLKTYGDDLVQINDANAYASVAAKDLRGDLEILRGMKAGLPAGVDLSKAKAWIYFTQSSNTIYASYGIKAITNSAVGQTLIEFAVPFKVGDASSYSSPVSYVPVLSFVTQTGNDHANVNAVGNRSIIYEYRNSGAGMTNHQYPACIAFFGELENE
jgi:hypothetical protein